MKKELISIIGTGHLGRALICGLLKKGYDAKSIIITNRNKDKLSRLVTELGVVAAETNSAGAQQADILILAVKPQFMEKVCLEIAPIVQLKQPLIISLAAVIEISQIQQWLAVPNLNVVRVMTNTPIEFNKGISALFAPQHLSAEHKNWIEIFFRKIGSIFWVDQEKLLDPLTAAIGSAPAYVFLFMEALQKAALSQGIPENLAEQIALNVVAGSVELAQHSTRSFSELRAGVTTPHGVTEHSLQTLSIPDFFASFQKIYQAASERIKEIR